MEIRFVGFVAPFGSVTRLAVLVGALALGGCSTTGILLTAAGIATDTSMTWAIVKHLHAKATEGDPVACRKLDSVERALSPRCGAFEPGSLRAADIHHTQLQGCSLALAARDPRLWPVLPELLDQGAVPETCVRSPMVELAQQPGCPDFAGVTPAVLNSLRWLAVADTRAVHHDVVRLLSCPQARVAGLDSVLAQWLAQGELEPGKTAFSPLAALHPSHVSGALAQAFEAHGHTARGGLGAYAGVQPGGFELALRLADSQALEWWLARAPELAHRVPSAQGNQLGWLPLARVFTPDFLAQPARREAMVNLLLAHGANPQQRLPYDSGRTVADHARALGSPLASMLDRPTATQVAAAHLPPGSPSR